MEAQKKDLEYYRKNAEDNYLTTPISVLRYITEMEKALRIHDAIGSFSSEKLKEAYNDGFGDSTYDFNTENYL